MVEKKHKKNREFAIGSKIDYNGKLYEVVNRASCDACSLKAICSNNDVEKSNSDVSMLRDERIRIFGECSSVARSDGKSVVFAEVKEVKEADVYDIDVLYKNDKELLPIKINIPNDYVIDEERSNLSNGIIKFKSKWLSIEDIYRLVKENNYFTHRSSIISFHDGKLVALANLMDIARYFNGAWNYNVTKEEDIGYVIVYDGSIKATNYIVRKIEACSNVYYGNIIFKNKDDAQYVIDNPNFRNILDKIFKV